MSKNNLSFESNFRRNKTSLSSPSLTYEIKYSTLNSFQTRNSDYKAKKIIERYTSKYYKTKNIELKKEINNYKKENEDIKNELDEKIKKA